jgi:hypothetical protein
VQSFGEKELYIQTSSTGLSSSEGIATTPTPCVAPQLMLPRSEDTVILRVHGISEAGTVFMTCECKVSKICTVCYEFSTAAAACLDHMFPSIYSLAPT